MNDDVIIKRIGADELQALQAISIKTFTTAFGPQNTKHNMDLYIKSAFSSAALLEEMNNPLSHFYLALYNGQVTGYLKLNSGDAQADLHEQPGLEISRIYVEEKFQGKSIGKMMLDKAFAVAATLEANLLWLGVWEKNVRAIDFYERNGFIKSGTHPFTLGEDIQTDVVMKRIIPY